GWALQLYALRSSGSWGIGDLADLRAFGGWAGEMGAGAIMINPLHATDPDRARTSPYFPSSRCFSNPLYLRIEELPGAKEVPAVAELGEQARRLNSSRRIERGRVAELKWSALEAIWRGEPNDPRYSEYCRKRGRLLDGYAAFM